MTRRRRWILLPLAALVAALIVVVILFDWNWLKGLVEGQVSAALGRDFDIAGDLDVDLGLHPRITIEDARLANAPWASDAPLLAVQRAEAAIDLPAVLQGRVELPEVSITEPAVRLETRPDGPPNWQLGPDEPSKGPPTIPRIGRLQVSDASIRYLEHGSGRAIAASLTEVSGSTDRPDGGMALSAAGEVEGEPLDLRLTGAPLAQLENQAEPYPLSLDLQLGESDLAGDVKLDLGGDVLAVSATLSSDQVRTTDFAWLIGDAVGESDASAGARKPGSAAQQAETAVTDAGGTQETTQAGGDQPGAQTAGQTRDDAWLDFEALPATSVDLQYTIARLEGPELMLRDVSLQAGLHQRLPSLALEGGGTFQGEPVMLDARLGPVEGEQRPQVPYSIDVEIEAGQTRITASGGIDRPERLQGIHVEFEARSADATELLRQIGIDVPELPGLQASGRLVREGEVWRVTDLSAQVGESDLVGQLSADLSEARPFVNADLRSNRLLAKDLMPAPEAKQVAEAAAGEAADELPDLITASGINFEALPEVDLSLHLQGDYVKVPQVVFEQLELDLELRDRVAVIDATGDGSFQQRRPLTFEVHAGSQASLENPDARYPLDVVLQAGNTRASAKGTVDRPLDFTGLDVQVHLEGPNLNQLGQVLQISLPDTPPYQLNAQATHRENRWNFVALRGEVGDSDLSGDITLQIDQERPIIYADLESRRLDFDDLGVLVGLPPGTGAQETASQRQERQATQAGARDLVLPTATFDVPQMRAVDARVEYHAQSVEAARLPLEGVALELRLEDGVMTLKPLRFDLVGGKLAAIGRLDGQADVIEGEIDLTARQIRLNELLSRFEIDLGDIELEKEGAGTLSGRAALDVVGNSIHQMAASADGELLLIMDGGRINALIIEAIGLDLGEIVALLLSMEEQEAETVPVQCFVGHFVIREGVMQTEALVLETSDATITGSGTIHLGEETLSLELIAHPKDPSVLTASTPVSIEGTFKNPEIDLISEALEEKSLAALALGVVLPVIGAIIPFLEEGETKDSNCGRLIASARSGMPGAPAPQGSK